MRLHEARSGGEGLERSCRRRAEGWIAEPRAGRGRRALSRVVRRPGLRPHRHDTYAIGLTDRGVQMFDYRGSTRTSTPGEVVTLYPDEPHDGRAGTREGFGYRIVYVQPARLSEALRALRGQPSPLPFVREPVLTDDQLARAVARAFDGSLESLAADSLIVDLAEGLAAAERSAASPRIDTRGRRARPAAARRRVHPRRPLDRARGDHRTDAVRPRPPVQGDARHEPASLSADAPSRLRPAADSTGRAASSMWPPTPASPTRRTSRAPSRPRSDSRPRATAR